MLLTKKLQRQLKLLEILFEGKKYRFSDLEEQLACSSKTLRTDLAEINAYAKGIDILADRESGVSSVISSHITEDYIYRIIMEESLEFRYLEAILLKNYNDYFILAEALFVSESTLRRVAEKVRALLKKYQLKIQGLTKISGDDRLITKLTIQFLTEKYHYFENAFPIEFCRWVQQLIHQFLSENKLTSKMTALDSKEQQAFYFLVASRIVQVEKGAFLVPEDVNQDFQFNSILTQRLILPKTKQRLSEAMLYYIFAPPMINQALGINGSEDFLESARPIIVTIDSFVSNLESKYQLIKEDKEQLRQKIIGRLNEPKIPKYLLYDTNQSMLKYVQPELEVMVAQLKRSLAQLEQKEQLIIEDRDLFVYDCVTEIILSWPSLLRKIEKNRQIKALVVTNDTRNYAKYLIKKLEHHLGNRYYFAANTTPSLTREMLHREKFDCIISNITLATTFSVPIFGISIFPKAREIYNLFEFYQQF